MTDLATTRRGLLRSACRHCFGLAGIAAGLPALAQGNAVAAAVPAAGLTAMPQRFSRPALDSEEGGLWAVMDREEARLRRSPFVVRDAALSKFLQDMVCRLTQDHCADVRVHVVRTPLFNASMAPNGMMQVWSGLLLRVDNEAQLAAVLGHELGHYLERHTLERLRDAKNKAAFAQFIGLFGLVGAIGQLGVLASMFSFSREQENSADRIGMRLMQSAGYDGRQAALVWDNLLGELRIKGGASVGSQSPMMATHPPVENRRDELLRLAGSGSGGTGTPEFRQAIAPHRLGWIHDEIKRGQFEESLVLFERLLKEDKANAQLLYARGEVYRQRAGKDDQQHALDSLNGAVVLDNPPPEAFRSLGLVQKQRDDPGSAFQSFEKYLAAAPDAPDAGLIRNYIAELKP